MSWRTTERSGGRGPDGNMWPSEKLWKEATKRFSEAVPGFLHCWLRNVAHRGSSTTWFGVELPRADDISLDVGGQGRVHALIFRQNHRNPEAGPAVLQELHLVTFSGSDALAIFEPRDLKMDKEQ